MRRFVGLGQVIKLDIDEERDHEAVEGAAHDHDGQERQEELDPAHRPANRVDGADVPGGGNRESVWIGRARRHALSVRATGRSCAVAVWAMFLQPNSPDSSCCILLVSSR